MIKGPWDHLDYRPDLSGVGRKLLQQGEKLGGKAPGQVEGLLKGLLGGSK